MTLRRKCTPRADQTAVFSEATGTIYPQGTDGPMAADGVVLDLLRNPVFQGVLCNLGGVLNTGELYDDAAPAAPPSIQEPYGPADEPDGRNTSLDKAGVAFPVEGPCQMSVRVADGVQVQIGYATGPGIYIEGQVGGGNGTGLVNVPAGMWWLSAKLDPRAAQSSVPANLWRGKA